MGLTALALLVALAHFGLALAILRTGRNSGGSAWAAVSVAFLGLFSLLTGLVEPAAAMDASGLLALRFSRLATASIALSSAFLFGSSLLFLAEKKLLPVLGGLAALAFSSWIASTVVTTPLHMVSIVALRDAVAPVVTAAPATGTARTHGTLYALLNAAAAAPALLAVLVQAGRMVIGKERIHRQRAASAFLGAGLGILAFWLLASVRSGVRPTYYLLPYAALVISSSLFASYNQSRLFDWRSIARNILVYSVLSVVFGGMAGLAVALVARVLSTPTSTATLVCAPLVFAIVFWRGRSFRDRFLARIGQAGEYRERLESALAHVDLSAGRDAVIADLHRILAEAFDFGDFAILIEDDRSNLLPVHASPGLSAAIGRGSPLALALEASEAQVILRTEVEGQPTGELHRAGMLGLFGSLRAESVVLAREGRRIVGLFSFGARRSGADYTEYDYESFRAIYGKLFVFAYYLKNVARESILYTVDRELALSDQVIRYATEKVDPVEHAAADTAWLSRSTRRLGGDFVDFVRLSRDRWFFVLGDVAGKGLSASMNMLILKSMTRSFLRFERDFAGLVQRVNAFIKDCLPRSTFFAGVFGYFDFAAGTVYFINCGVPAMLLYSPSFDAFVEVQGEGKVLGFVRDISPWLKPRKLSLPPGSALVVTTDGILESENLRGERFGKDRLRRSALGRMGDPARRIADGAFEDLLAFTDQRQEDDITLLVVKIPQRRET